MKTLLLISILTAGAYFGYQHLPANVRAKANGYLGAIGLANLDPAKLLPPLKATVEPLAHSITAAAKEKVLPENPVKNREALIQKLESNLKTVSNAAIIPAKTREEKEKVSTAIKEAEILIDELKEENPKSGAFAETVAKIANAVLPQSTESKNDPVICPQ